MRRPLTALALLLLAPLAMGQAYKWTDASGTVHYSDNPPPQGTQYKRITTSGSAEPLAAQGKRSSEGGSETPAGGSRPQQQPQKPVADTPENRTKLCGTLKSNLELLHGKQAVITQEGGQQKLLDDSQRQQQQAMAEAQYKQFCSDKP
jgi:hypothetical protein